MKRFVMIADMGKSGVVTTVHDEDESGFLETNSEYYSSLRRDLSLLHVGESCPDKSMKGNRLTGCYWLRMK